MLKLDKKSSAALALACDVRAWIIDYWRRRGLEPWLPNPRREALLLRTLIERMNAALSDEDLILSDEASAHLRAAAGIVEHGITTLEAVPQRRRGARPELARHLGHPLSAVCLKHCPLATNKQIREFAAEVFALAGIGSFDPDAHPERIDPLLWPRMERWPPMEPHLRLSLERLISK